MKFPGFIRYCQSGPNKEALLFCKKEAKNFYGSTGMGGSGRMVVLLGHGVLPVAFPGGT
jgi:hypothetical protein